MVPIPGSGRVGGCVEFKNKMMVGSRKIVISIESGKGAILLCVYRNDNEGQTAAEKGQRARR